MKPRDGRVLNDPVETQVKGVVRADQELRTDTRELFSGRRWCNRTAPRLGVAPAVFAAAVLWLIPASVSAQIYINEILPNPFGVETGPDERVEIYNVGPTAVVIRRQAERRSLATTPSLES